MGMLSCGLGNWSCWAPGSWVGGCQERQGGPGARLTLPPAPPLPPGRYEKLTYTSDYFPQLVDLAERLIRAGKIYADDTPQEQMRAVSAPPRPCQRRALLLAPLQCRLCTGCLRTCARPRSPSTLPHPPAQERMDGIDSQRRSRPVEENLRLWAEMQAGSEEGLKNCMRIKMDMQVGLGSGWLGWLAGWAVLAGGGVGGLVVVGGGGEWWWRGVVVGRVALPGAAGAGVLCAVAGWCCSGACTRASPDFCGGRPAPVAPPPSQGQAQQRWGLG
jgi:hypothetical protein